MGDKKKKTREVQKLEVIGQLDITKSGMGYVAVEGFERDIMVKPQDLGRALTGDKVKVSIPKFMPTGKRVEGKIIEVISRSSRSYSGTMEVNGTTAFFVPSKDYGIPDFYIPIEALNGAENGSHVMARVKQWEKKDKKPIGEIVELLNPDNVGDLAMKEIILENGFPISFSDEAIAIANSLSEEITDEELGRRRDYRGTLTLTIDPFDAKDFDDALSFKDLGNGRYEVGVHIADVTHFVKPGTTLDSEAYARATSVYLPDRVNPMLPEKISNELCSLRPDEDKFAFSTVFEMNDEGKIFNQWIGRTVIRSNRRFTYEEAQQIIETGEGDHNEAILLLDKIAKRYRAERFANGAINFSSQEVKFILDDTGKPIKVVVKEIKDSNKLIEEFMLLANRVVAKYVSDQKVKGEPVPFPYRVHDTPDEEKLAPFAAFARKFGYRFDLKDEDAIAKSFNDMLRDVKGKPEQHVLEQLGIRTMAKASYTIENIGHYGLGFEDYCHFTSPIRRYPDVLVHRVLQQCLDKDIQPDKKMEVKCKHCSERERAAMESERSGNKYKQVEYMTQFVGEEFDAVISGVSHFGFWAETVAHKCEGLVGIRELQEYDNFQHDAVDYQLIGAKTGRRFRIGDNVRIQVMAANLDKKQLDYDWVPDKKK